MWLQIILIHEYMYLTNILKKKKPVWITCKQWSIMKNLFNILLMEFTIWLSIMQRNYQWIGQHSVVSDKIQTHIVNKSARCIWLLYWQYNIHNDNYCIHQEPPATNAWAKGKPADLRSSESAWNNLPPKGKSGEVYLYTQTGCTAKPVLLT